MTTTENKPKPRKIPHDLAHNACGMRLGHDAHHEPQVTPEDLKWLRGADGRASTQAGDR